MIKTSTSYMLGLLQGTRVQNKHDEVDFSDALPQPALTPAVKPDMELVLKEALKDRLSHTNTIVD